MVFSSLPSYPSNWQQQANPQPTTTITSSQLVVLPSLPAAHGGGGGGGSAAIRPTPMAERARMANIPMQENAQICPRCDSSNTKFCYYNNYNLTQPRHFCKTCRRYWTRGGALRNVPVGGGCRRNKRNKSSGSSSSKSTASTSTSTGTTASNSTTTSCGPTTLLGLTPQIPPLRFMTPMSQLGDHFIPGDLGLHYGGISTPLLQPNHDVMHNFPLGISNISLGGGGGVGGGGGGSTFYHATGVDSTPPWRFQPCQISSMAGLEGHGSGSMLFPFQGNINNNNMENNSVYSNDVRPKMGVLKMEDNLQEMNLSSRQLLGINHDHHHHHQYNYHNWGNNGGGGTGTSNNSWPDLSGFSSSSTTSNAL